MSVTVEYTCDRCGHKQATAEQMWSIGISYMYGVTQTFYLTPSLTSHGIQQWCTGCMVLYSLLTGHVAEVAIAPPPTLEDIVRLLIQEELSSKESRDE